MSDSEHCFNLQKLSNANDPYFIENVRTAAQHVKPNQLKEYFKVLLSHFLDKLHTSQGTEILHAVFAGLLIDQGPEIFAENKFIYKLPFKDYVDDVLDVLFVLVNKIPDIFDQRAAAYIGLIVPKSPRKCLTLISIFAQYFEEVSNYIPMLDLLFHHFEAFRTNALAADYISLLIWLLQECPQFRESRFEHTWSYLCEMLRLTKPRLISLTYNALCSVYEIDPEKVKTFGYPVKAIAFHLQVKSTQDAVLSLLLRYPPPPTTKHIDRIILALIEIAKTDETATLILLSLAMEKSNAEILITNSEWMTLPLPEYLDTLRLFVVILLNHDLRKKVVERMGNSITFFVNLLKDNSVGVCNAVCNIMKRLPLTQDYVSALSSSGFLRDYFNFALSVNDSKVHLSALRLLNTIAKVRFVPEFMTMISFVVELCKKGGKQALPAAAVAACLARYPKCAAEFKNQKLDEFFNGSIDDPQFRYFGDKFLHYLKMIDDM